MNWHEGVTFLSRDVVINSSKVLRVPGNETHNLYEMETRQYDKLLRENITKHYNRTPAKAYDLKTKKNTKKQKHETRSSGIKVL